MCAPISIARNAKGYLTMNFVQSIDRLVVIVRCVSYGMSSDSNDDGKSSRLLYCLQTAVRAGSAMCTH